MAGLLFMFCKVPLISVCVADSENNTNHLTSVSKIFKQKRCQILCMLYLYTFVIYFLFIHFANILYVVVYFIFGECHN